MKKRNLSKGEKRCAVCLIAFFVVALIIGIKSVYAYYYETPGAKSIFTAYVDDFYVAQGDISINVYQKFTTVGSETVYKRTNAIPKGKTAPASVSCTEAPFDASGNATNSTTAVACSTAAGNCQYTYDSTNGKITLKSKVPVRCKFYFN